MDDDGNDWCMIPGAVLAERGVICLREPAWSNRQSLAERLRQGKYAKPFVMDDGQTRRLHFSLDYVQSEMCLGDPDALSFSYTRKMMAFLLFQPKPRQIVIVGLGGGSLTKFCHRHLPRARITTVEIDRDVIALGELFDLPPPGARLQLLHADARDYFAQAGAPVDVVLLDACDRQGTAPELCDERFYRNVRDRLHPYGMAVVNLTGAPRRVERHLRIVGRVFEERVIVIDVQDCDNRLAFAFNHGATAPDWPQLAQCADELSRRCGLDFQEFARLLRRSYVRQKLRSRWRPADAI